MISKFKNFEFEKEGKFGWGCIELYRWSHCLNSLNCIYSEVLFVVDFLLVRGDCRLSLSLFFSLLSLFVACYIYRG